MLFCRQWKTKSKVLVNKIRYKWHANERKSPMLLAHNNSKNIFPFSRTKKVCTLKSEHRTNLNSTPAKWNPKVNKAP